MSETKLKRPAEYIDSLNRLRERSPYASHWTLTLKRHTNRHPETNGGRWGWYEIHPLGVVVGHWSEYGRDDLVGIDIGIWNDEAARLSHPITADAEVPHA